MYFSLFFYKLTIIRNNKLSRDALRKFIAGNVDQTNGVNNVKIIRTDNGSEFQGIFTSYVQNGLKAIHHKGLKHNPESDLCHETIHAVQNRLIRTHLITSGLPIVMWPYAIKHYYYNR